MPRPWRVKALRSDGQVVPSSAAAALTPAQLLGQGVGAFGLSPVGQQAAGLPAQMARLGRRQTGRVAWCLTPPAEESGERLRQ
jgi:hypothetical protein